MPQAAGLLWDPFVRMLCYYLLSGGYESQGRVSAKRNIAIWKEEEDEWDRPKHCWSVKGAATKGVRCPGPAAHTICPRETRGRHKTVI